MARKRYSPEEVIQKLREAEVLLSQGQKKYQSQTPAMASELTDSIWSVRKLLLTSVFSTSGRGQTPATPKEEVRNEA
jgi:hypothetical protein